ncbi:MAG TPA: NlpC/P60 family protein [Phycisphaerae bacterium]|nr:NlpC/P60 family protein [Phycisphaerae bacterium]
MITRDQLITEALTWKDTPYHHHQSCKGAGCDCVGLVYGVCLVLGILPPTWKPDAYTHQWHLHKNEEVLLKLLHREGARLIPLSSAQPGDIVTFQYGRVSSHLGILLPGDRIIHAHMDVGHVDITLFTGPFKARARQAFVIPGVV